MRKFTLFSVTRGLVVTVSWAVVLLGMTVLSPALLLFSIIAAGAAFSSSKSWGDCKERLDNVFGPWWCGFKESVRDYPKCFTEAC